MAKPVVIPAARAKLVQVFGGDIYLTMPSDEAGTWLSVFEDVRGPGDGPPLHESGGAKIPQEAAG